MQEGEDGCGLVVIAVAGIVVGLILGLFAALAGDGVHCLDPSCPGQTAMLTQAFVSCLLATGCLAVAAFGLQPFVFRMVAGGAFTFATVQTFRGHVGVVSVFVALLAFGTFSFAAIWWRDNR